MCARERIRIILMVRFWGFEEVLGFWSLSICFFGQAVHKFAFKFSLCPYRTRCHCQYWFFCQATSVAGVLVVADDLPF